MVSIGHDGQVIIWDMFAAVKLKVFQIKVSHFVIIITACLHALFPFFLVLSSISLYSLSSFLPSLSSSMKKRVFRVYLIANGHPMVSLVQLLIVLAT